MSRSHAGWSAGHIDTLLTGSGLLRRDSGIHTFYLARLEGTVAQTHGVSQPITLYSASLENTA
jgi:hypothetical protein